MSSQLQKGVHPGVLALTASAFAIGVAEFLVVGILPAIAAYLAIPLDAAGSLVSLYALALAVGTPFLVAALARFPHKPVLAGLLLVFLAGNLLAAFSSSYALLLLGRMITAVAHGAFFAVGTSVAGSMAPPGQQGRAIALMLAGLTLAMVVGVPAGSYLGNLVDWRLPFFAVVGLAGLSLLALLRWLPGSLPASASGNISTQLAALRNPAILTMMLVTLLGFGSSFAAFTYITAILTEVTGFAAATASLLLVVFGTATFIGNLLGGRLAERLGWSRTLLILLLLLAGVLALLALALATPWATVLLLFVWGSVAFGLSPNLQAGMLATAQRYTPAAVDFASGLNISAFNLGISLGAFVGGMLVARDMIAATPWAGVLAALLALAPLAWLTRRETRDLAAQRGPAGVPSTEASS